MDNHTHLIIYDNGNDISKLIKSINISYRYYFNNTYKRSGHLFQDGFKSELIIDDNYLLQVSKYIHNNPVKAGMVKTYKWSSYNIYTKYRTQAIIE
ncbi:MAG: transposase, partial [Desulfotomaculum sp.]|nr:transposase [Desulfotomaculum sp.]